MRAVIDALPDMSLDIGTPRIGPAKRPYGRESVPPTRYVGPPRQRVVPCLSWLDIAPRTGPLDVLRGKHVLVLCDTQNITQGAIQLGFRFSYRQLADIIRQTAARCALHAFFSTQPDDERKYHYFVNRGWQPYMYPIHTVGTIRGHERRSNIDFTLAFFAGAVVTRIPTDAVVGIASGDGLLVADVARAIKSLPSPRRVVTFSLAGSTAQSLNAATNRLIDANIELGHDVLHNGKDRQWE